jgi:hypothetical protein
MVPMKTIRITNGRVIDAAQGMEIRRLPWPSEPG